MKAKVFMQEPLSCITCKREYGDQFAATDALDKALNDANALYMKHVKLARIALKGERGAAQSLDLDGRRKQTYSGWIAQASVGYFDQPRTSVVSTSY